MKVSSTLLRLYGPSGEKILALLCPILHLIGQILEHCSVNFYSTKRPINGQSNLSVSTLCSPSSLERGQVHFTLHLAYSIYFGIMFKLATSFLPSAYSDTDWMGCLDDKQSTTCFCFYLGSSLISWFAKRQSTFPPSGVEVNIGCRVHDH